MWSSQVVGVLPFVVVTAAGGCDGLGDLTDPPVESADYLMFAIGAVVEDGPPAADFQDRVPLGMTHFFDNHDPASPEFVCQHDETETIEKIGELQIPDDLPCAGDVEAGGGDGDADADGDVDVGGYTGPVGRNPKPEHLYDWRGATEGGCGVWATAMCDRVLGMTSAETQVDEAEWNRLADALELSTTGGTKASAEVAYYRSRGWCVEDKKFHGSTGDYEELRERLEDDHCDVKFDYYRRTSDGYTDGHVETVVGVSGTTATTNSWGHEAAVRGGSDGHFEHSGDGAWMGDEGGRLWPADETDVWVTYVCECRLSRMEQLARALFGD